MITDSLPGAELIRRGLDDLHHDRPTVEALLVLIGAPRLRALGIPVPETPQIDSPEHRLFEKLAEVDIDSAHSRYNALVRTLVSFERAAACGS